MLVKTAGTGFRDKINFKSSFSKSVVRVEAFYIEKAGLLAIFVEGDVAASDSEDGFFWGERMSLLE